MITIISKTISKISYLVIFIISLILILYLWLLHGIKIDSFALPFADIKGLYIKLDKKLIVKADYIKIKKNYKNKKITNQATSIKNYIKYFNKIFKNLDIKKIQYNDQNITLRYNKELFFIENNQLYLLASIILQNRSNITANIKKLYLKKNRISFRGLLKIDIFNNKIEYDGKLFTHNINSKAKFTYFDNTIEYYIYDANTNNIEPFMKFLNTHIKIPNRLSDWMYRYIIAKSYHLKYLYGKYNLKTNKFYPDLIKAAVTAKNVKVRFHNSLTPIKINKIDIKLKKDLLSFKLYHPSYENIDLNGSKVKISNLFTKGSNIEIFVKTKHIFDKKIKTLLMAYGVNIPLLQKSGNVDSLVKIKLSFFPYKSDIEGNFHLKDSRVVFKNIEFFSKKADIALKNGKITIDDTNIKYKNIFDIDTNGTFDVKSQLYSGKLKIKSLTLDYKNEKLLNIKDKDSNVSIEFNNNTIYLKDLNTILKFKKDGAIFKINSLSKLYPFSKFLQKYTINKGEVTIKTKNFQDYYINTYIPLKTQKIVFKNSKPIKKLNITATIKNGSIFAKTVDNSIIVKVDKNINIYTNNISFDLKNREKNSKKVFTKFDKIITLDANNSTIYLNDNITLPTEKFTLFINKRKKIFSSIYKENHIFYSKDKNKADIHTNFLNANYLNTIIGYHLFKKGFVKLSVKEKQSFYYGKCNLVKIIIKSNKKNGSDFKIDGGKFDFYLKNSVLNLEKITLKNSTSTLKGSGYIDLKSKKLYLEFNVIILKKLGKNIKAIPLVGYLLLGKNGKFTSKVIVSGTFENPQIKTDFAKDVITSPLNIIFRAIRLPFKLLEPNKTNP